ncbi:hypothetical protein GCM10023185_05030 [Hymenobacter saemangeumensis]|uniref:T9SS type A sorting domain-containing protein n=1 Tax=Hymenobacter saemangeumensis TaxID=1084522 RepID=A0ABP8I0V0_9BACT
MSLIKRLSSLFSRPAGALLAALLLPCLSSQAQSAAPAWAWAVNSATPTAAVRVYGTAADAAGNVYVVGQINGSGTFGATTLSNVTGAYVGKLNPAGQWEWLQTVPNASTFFPSYATDVAIDNAGNVLVGGFFTGTITAGSSPTITATGGNSGFVAKLDPSNRTWLWATRSAALFGSTHETIRGRGLAVDAANNVAVSGSFSGSITLGSTSLTSINNTADMYVGKLNGSTGQWLWAVRAGGGGGDVASSVATDPAGNVILTGMIEGQAPTATVGSTMVTGAGSYDGLVARFAAATGVVEWAYAVGSPRSDNCNAAACDAQGNVYITGGFQSTVTLGSLTLNSDFLLRIDDIYVAKLSPSGQWLWAVSGGGASEDFGEDLQLDAAGNLYVAATVRSSTPTFGSVTVSTPRRAAFVAHLLASNGAWQWVTSGGAAQPAYTYNLHLTAAPGGNPVYVTGTYSPSAVFGPINLANNRTSYTPHFIAKLGSGPATGVRGSQAAAPLGAWPNPVAAGRMLQLPFGGELRLLDALGRETAHTLLPASFPTWPVPVQLAPGSYTVLLTAPSGKLYRQQLLVTQ